MTPLPFLDHCFSAENDPTSPAGAGPAPLRATLDASTAAAGAAGSAAAGAAARWKPEAIIRWSSA